MATKYRICLREKFMDDAHDLGVDFIGSNLHKWIGAPLGVGFIYVAKSRLADIDRAMGDEDRAPTDIRSRVHTGT